jgi:hypothetical protein
LPGKREWQNRRDPGISGAGNPCNETLHDVTYITVELSDYIVAENDAVAVVFLLVVNGTRSHSGQCSGLDILGANLDFDLGCCLVERVGPTAGGVGAVPHIVPVRVDLTNLTGDLSRHLLVDLENN